MTSRPKVTSYVKKLADDLAPGGHVMSTNMADDLIMSTKMAVDLLMQKVNRYGGRPCPRRSRDVNKYVGRPTFYVNKYGG